MVDIFNTIMMFLGVLGKRFADAGLKDLLIQRSVVAEGSTDKSLCMKQYNQSVRSVNFVYEAFSRILLEMLHEQYENKYELHLYNLKIKIKNFNLNKNQE